MMALAAVVAGASGQSLNGTGPAPPRQMTRGPPATEEDAEPTTVERGVEDDTCALSGDTMFALIAMCRERKCYLATDQTAEGEAMAETRSDRYTLTMGATVAEGEGDGGRGGEGGWEYAAAPRRDARSPRPPPCSPRPPPCTMLVRSLSVPPTVPYCV